MSTNPYEAPKASLKRVVGVKSGKREDLRKVAGYQKAILICILIYFGAIVGQFVVPENLRPIVGILVLIDGLVATVFVFLLAIKVYSTGVGILLGILTILPCVGLIVLLVINNKATSLLKANGYRVGFLGADMSQFPS